MLHLAWPAIWNLHGRKWKLSYVIIFHSVIECFHSRGQHLCKFSGTKESLWDTNMAAVSLFWDTNMAAVTSCENILLMDHFLFLTTDVTQECHWQKNIWLPKGTHYITYISHDFWYFPLKNPLLKHFTCCCAHILSILIFTGFVKLFQAALKSRSGCKIDKSHSKTTHTENKESAK